MPATSKRSASKFDVHPSVFMLQKWISELKNKTGKSLDDWMKLCKKEGPADATKRMNWLKTEFDMGTNTAWWLAERSFGRATEHENPEAYLKEAAQFIEDMYAGKRSALRPIQDRIIQTARRLFKDIRVCPCKTMVPLFRNHLIAQIKPSTLTRIDLGFALGPTKASGRLLDTGGYAKKDRITHRIPITKAEEIDAEIEKWLKKAYEMDK